MHSALGKHYLEKGFSVESGKEAVEDKQVQHIFESNATQKTCNLIIYYFGILSLTGNCKNKQCYFLPLP